MISCVSFWAGPIWPCEKLDSARRVLLKAQERDARSRHKTLMKLARIEYATGNFEDALKCAMAASRFFQENWGNPFFEGLFWQAVCVYRLGEMEKARKLAGELEAYCPHYPRLDVLKAKLKGKS